MQKEVIDRAFSYFAQRAGGNSADEAVPQDQGEIVELPSESEDAIIDALFAMLGA